MRVGVIGATSNIAAKAYLPVYASLQETHDFVIYSRDLIAAEKIRQSYQFSQATSEMADLETCDVVMIHAATSQHYQLAKHFLSAGIYVFVDKPATENLSELIELQELAASVNRLFVVGFNRRFVPGLKKLKTVSAKNFVKVTKNLINEAGELTFKLYDVFIHPLDTLIYLLDDDILDWQSCVCRDEKGQLTQVSVFVQTATTSGLAMMNLQAGAYAEEFAVESPSGTYKLSDLTHSEIIKGSTRELSEASGWSTAPDNRGFADMVKSMFAAVSGEKIDLKQDKIVQSHEIIARILEKENLHKKGEKGA